ncbi:hypothetical protein ABW02_18475 [Niallia circulans]|uniref:XRE family transcriptional regulator n=3 Tax=Bacillaceae TaxID=186817 RepID=A0A2N0Z9B3_9BACI|nr:MULTISPECIES: helix-turn-helix transcriptional regulator [Bacillaceae]SLL36711.1 Predicted transcriptional regulator [Mycobacteroides abscessus subsp. abscessus]HEO8421709.1 helix-turn-helix transcriptional regulator [Yersinia enterocolitica]KAB7666174.1 helix-turn-helix transcriptional regulator [Bacillus sp. B1-b2]KLV24164.1 hypothetical protein ABW02_18475 [Niallia circulans]MCM3363102.1 helix-turn-helix domain-containing protein [Niallia sp. MER TA 168]
MKCTKLIKQEHHLKIDSKKIKLARAEMGWTITKLADVSGVNRKTIGEIEKGTKKKVRFSTIKQIAENLNKEVEDLCTQVEKGG